MNKKSGKGPGTVAVGVRLAEPMVDWMKTQEGGVSGAIKDAVDVLRFLRLFDLPTQNLARDIMLISQDLQRYGGGLEWHSSPKMFDALSEAIRAWLERARPMGPTGAAEDLLGPLDPVTLGRVVAQMHFDHRLENVPGWQSPFNRQEIYKGSDEK